MIKYTSLFKFTLRIVSSPLVLSMLIVSYVFHAVRRWILFVKYGGEFISYDKDSAVTIQDVYVELKKSQHGKQ